MTNFLNYAVSSHGRIVDNDFIILPKGIRVVGMCTISTCPLS